MARGLRCVQILALGPRPGQVPALGPRLGRSLARGLRWVQVLARVPRPGRGRSLARGPRRRRVPARGLLSRGGLGRPLGAPRPMKISGNLIRRSHPVPRRQARGRPVRDRPVPRPARPRRAARHANRPPCGPLPTPGRRRVPGAPIPGNRQPIRTALRIHRTSTSGAGHPRSARKCAPSRLRSRSRMCQRRHPSRMSPCGRMVRPPGPPRLAMPIPVLMPRSTSEPVLSGKLLRLLVPVSLRWPTRLTWPMAKVTTSQPEADATSRQLSVLAGL